MERQDLCLGKATQMQRAFLPVFEEVMYRTMSPADPVFGSRLNGPLKVLFGRSGRLFQGIPFCEKGCHGRGEGTACPVIVTGFHPFSLKHHKAVLRADEKHIVGFMAR